ncbi:SnoaL-like domain [Prauserella sp. Am3]|nr:SnoaL-like domain [Prauserella sp. Am3]
MHRPADLAELVEVFRGGFAHADADVLADLWADDADDLRYVAGERARLLRTRDEIARYYSDALGGVDVVDTAEVTDLLVDAGTDRGHVVLRFRFAGSAGTERFDVDIRVTMVAFRGDDGWALVHYHESTPGPL